MRPYGGEDGSGYGEGDGTVEGAVRGRLRWVNHPRRRGDAVMLPDVHGLLETDDGARILVKLDGRTPTAGEEEGQQLLRVRFETEDDRYRWLNLVFAVAEGNVDFETLVARMRVYRCVHELV